MNEDRRRSALQICDQFRRGILTAEEACARVILVCNEPQHAAEYVALLPDELRATLPGWLKSQPSSDDGWAGYDEVQMADGNEHVFAWIVAQYRAAVEAVRAVVLGEASPPPAPDFRDRVRTAFLARMDEFLRRTVQADPGH